MTEGEFARRAQVERLARLESVARCAAAYVACIAEFSDTAAGDLSNCCSEYFQLLDVAVDRWKRVESDIAAAVVRAT